MPGRRRAPAPEQQAEQLRDRFGLREQTGFPPVTRPHTDPALAEALAVPFYSLLYTANVVPREAAAQRGRLERSLALNVGVPRRRGASGARCAVERSQLMARVLMAQFDAPGAVFDVQALEWDEATDSGTLAIEVASGRGAGDSLARIEGGRLDGVLEALLDAVRPEPQSAWRWVHPVVGEEKVEEFATLARDTAFEVLTVLVGSAPGSCRPLKTVPDW